MRKRLLTAAALAAMFLLGAPADRAAAVASATPAQLGPTDPDSGLAQKAALVCGRLGCRRGWIGRRVMWGARRVWWGVRRVARWRRYAWGPRRYWWGARQAAWRPRPLFAYAGADSGYAGSASGWGWFSP